MTVVLWDRALIGNGTLYLAMAMEVAGARGATERLSPHPTPAFPAARRPAAL